jgi:hypothetical protein
LRTRSKFGAIGGVLVIGALSVGSAFASSHREAPLITLDPVADNTDLYAFVSPDKPDTVTIIGDWIPLEEPAGGPNFQAFGNDVLYEFHVDNNGDGNDDVTFGFRFATTYENPNTYLFNTGPVTSLTDADLNVRQNYYVSMIRSSGGSATRTTLKSGIPVAPPNIGPRSTPDYDALAASAVTDLGNGIKSFAGPRDDPFFVDLGSIFDLGGLRPLNSLHLIPLANQSGVDGLKGYNTHSIALQVPISMLTSDGKVHTASEAAATIGIWASSRRQTTTVLSAKGLPPTTKGNYIQSLVC